MANRKAVKKLGRLAKQRRFSKSNGVKVDPLEGKRISEDLAITYFFRLENDPRETCEYFKKEVDFGF